MIVLGCYVRSILTRVSELPACLIDETNVADYIGKTIRAQKASVTFEGVILGRSNAVVC